MSADLQTRFAQALRRELGIADAQPGASVVHIAAPSVSVMPVIKATLPALDGPLEVLDIGRVNGAFGFRMTVKRDAGLITEVQATPTEFVPLGAFE